MRPLIETVTDKYVAGVAADVTSEELPQAKRWIAARFTEMAEAEQLEPGLVVLSNHDPVVKNRRGEGRPLTIAKAEYRRMDPIRF